MFLLKLFKKHKHIWQIVDTHYLTLTKAVNFYECRGKGCNKFRYKEENLSCRRRTL